jgi:hypothetical protein
LQSKDSQAAAIARGDADIRVQSAEEGTKVIDRWQSFVQMRIAIDKGDTTLLETAIKDNSLPRDWVFVDAMDAARKHAPKSHITTNPAIEALRKQLLTMHLDVPNAKTADFFQNLPEPETSHRVPSYSKGNGSLFGPSNVLVSEGYMVTPEEAGLFRVAFKGDQLATGSMVEEMALLCAANTARDQGKKGIIVVRREDVQTTNVTTYYSTPLRTDPGSFETTLYVVFVDPTSLPEEYKDGDWRVIDADDVYNQLAPVYLPQKQKPPPQP